MTLGDPVFLTDRGDLMVSGLTTCTVIDEHKYQCELSSFTKDMPLAGTSHFPFSQIQVRLYPFMSTNTSPWNIFLCTLRGSGGGVWIKWKEFGERAPFLPEQ